MDVPSNSSKDVAPPPKFLEGLAKYYKNDLEGAKEFLDGDDLYSKALLVLVEVKMDDGSKNKEIQGRIDAMDFKGNDIALMFCVLAQEYSLQMTNAHNLLLKRFGKEEKVIVSQKEFDENEANTQAKETNTQAKETNTQAKETNTQAKETNTQAKESEEMPELESAEVKKVEPDAKPAAAIPEAKPAVTPEVKQVGGKRVTRKASSLPKKKKRVSRGKA